MRKILGSFGMTARPSHRFVPLFLFMLLPLSATLCRAESCEPGGSFPVETITSINYPVMFPGNTYNLKIKGIFPYDIPTYPGCNLNEDYVIEGYGTANEQSYPDVSFVLESGSSFYSQGTFTATEIDITIIIGPNAPLGTAELVLTGDGGDSAIDSFQIGDCATPTITSVKPSTWFAGKSYDNVKIIGTNFTTTAESNKTGCPVTPVTITAADGSTVPLTGVTVDSKTKITLSGVAPPVNDPTETATVTAGTVPNAGTFNTAQILGNQILFQNTPVNNPYNPPPVVVGQQIALTTPALPSGITATSMIWRVEGTRIADYAPTTDGASVTELTNDDLKKSNVTFYWVYGEPNAAVSYEYCVDIPGAGNQCSTADADFEVDGYDSPSISVDNYHLPSVDSLDACYGIPGGPYLDFGKLHGPHTPCTAIGQPGIQFSPQGTPPGNGDTFFVQIVNSDIEHETGRGTPYGCTSTPGLDGVYPYQDQYNPASVPDAPEEALPKDQKRVTRNFNARTYLFWKSDTDDSIPVPLAYVSWAFDARAHRILGSWSPSGGGTNQGPQLADSSQTRRQSPTETQTVHGIPLWDAPVIPTCGPQPDSAEDQ